jgi:predicted acylesterase/phospholipase RssA
MSDTNGKERAYVVFQGGGALGIAHFGAWKAIEENFDIVGVAGTSSGSIAAALCAARCSSDEAFNSFQQNLPRLVDYKNPLCSIINIILRALFERNASNDGRSFQNWLDRELKHSGLNKDNITFDELYQHNGIYLQIVACDLKDPNDPTIVYSREKRKYEPISHAVRASISLPGFFTAIRSGNRVLVDGGLKLNFPIQRLYELAKREEAVLIGVRFKKSQKSFNPLNLRHIFSTSYELVMGNSSQIPKKIREYPWASIIEIDDRGFNPLNFNLKEQQILELKNAGEEVAREQLEKLQEKIKIARAKISAQVSLEIRESVEQAQNWFNREIMPKIEGYCDNILNLERFSNKNIKKDVFVWRVYQYIERISESLWLRDYNLLKYHIFTPTSPELEVYLAVLDLIKGKIPDYLTTKQEIIKRIDYLKEQLIKNN